MLRNVHIAVLALFTTPVVAQDMVFEVRTLAIRPAGEDYAPVPLDSGFVMCSVREATGAVDIRDAATNKPLSDLFWVPFKDGVPGTPVLFSAALTTPVNEGPASFANGGRTICYTRNLSVPKKSGNLRGAGGQLGLFFSRRGEGGWEQPQPFAYNSPKHAVMHPAFSPDGHTLYFASDMPGGFGGMDLYRSERTPEGWSAPVNLGPEVNGPANEVFPVVHADGTLCFSSDRAGGLGKLDIYRTARENGKWSTPAALPAPVNSPHNDYGYAALPGGFEALFTSDRDGKDAIHVAKRSVPKFRDCAEQQRNNYCYAFKARPHAATRSLPLDHVWDLGDGTRTTDLAANHCYKAPGTYEVRSILVDRKSGAVFHVLRTHEHTVEDHVQAYIAAPDTVRTGRTLALDARLSHVPGMTIAEHHWDLGDGGTKRGARTTHQFKNAGTYEVRLDLLAAPDADGRIRNRCNTKRVTVIDRYREQEDMTVVAVYQDGLGNTHSFEFQELPYDHLGMGAEDMGEVKFAVELFASKERVSLDDPRFMRVMKHYRVVERFDPERGVYTYSVGEADSIEELYQVYMKVKELGFLDADVHMLREEKLVDLSQLDLASLEELNHTKLRTNAIHFEYKSAVLGEGSLPVLAQVTALLRQHPGLHLVIEAHTDDIGGRAYNLDLSQQRAMAVVEYLVEQDIDPRRLIPVGHGKNQPIASNKTEEGRSRNRRVEFRMTVKEGGMLVDVRKR